jgi:hypothetical protein
VLLLIKNIKFKEGKLILKFISLLVYLRFLNVLKN